MKRIRINKGTIGLVFRKGDYKRILTEGIHWLGINEKVTVYNLAKPFTPEVELKPFVGRCRTGKPFKCS